MPSAYARVAQLLALRALLAHMALTASAVRFKGLESLHAPRRKPAHESLFNSILGGMLTEDIVPPGDILDAGANRGDTAVFLATAAPKRTVLAIDPHGPNVRFIIEIAEKANLPNIVARRAALAEVERRVDSRSLKTWGGGQVHSNTVYALPPAQGSGYEDTSLQLLTIDGLFENRTAGFLHLDLEGGEQAALAGATRVLGSATPPVVSVEGHSGGRHTRQLVRLLSRLVAAGNACFQVDEVCGAGSCTNYLCFPIRHAERFYGSHTLDLAVGTGTLRLVNASSAAALLSIAPTAAERVRLPRLYPAGRGSGERARTFQQEMEREPQHR